MARTYIEGDEARIERTDFCKVTLTYYDGRRIENLEPRRLFPLSGLHKYITLLDGEGAYMKTPKKVILCVARKHSFPKVRDVVKEVDPHAFVIVSSATEIFGKGYKSQFTDEM